MYKIEYSKEIEKDLSKIPKKDILKIRDKIVSLSKNPRSQNTTDLKGKKNFYRIRSGDYRIIYQILDDRLIVFIVRIAHRKDVYRD